MNAYLLLEISPILLINENQVEIVTYAEFLVHFPERRCQLETAKEKANGYRLSYVLRYDETITMTMPTYLALVHHP